MRGYNNWNYKPYLSVDQSRQASGLHICGIAPEKTSVYLEWLDLHNKEATEYTLTFTPSGTDNWQTQRVPGTQSAAAVQPVPGTQTAAAQSAVQATISHLAENTDYRVYVLAQDGRKSLIRCFRTSAYPGSVVNYLHPQDPAYDFSGQYLCSPSLLKLPGGALLASMDVYGRRTAQNLTRIFRSDDDGVSWHFLTDIFPCFWGKLFWHRGALFLLGVSTEYGDLLIGCSDDNGQNWSAPTVISRGSGHNQETGHHRAPMPILPSKGRLWTGTEYGSWSKKRFMNSLLSIDENDDLMSAENWRFTDFIPQQPDWPGSEPAIAGAIEGNAVESPEGKVLNILRYAPNKALVLKADPDNPEHELQFCRFIDFPLAHSKFEIQRHSNGIYYAVGNSYPARTVLSVYQSQDLIHWQIHSEIVNFRQIDPASIGFQYPSFCFDGDDLLVLSRTAFNQPANFHDSNTITFHRLSLLTFEKQDQHR